MKTIEDLKEALSMRVLKANPNVKADIFDKCVDMKKLTRIEATNIENGTLSLDELESQKLFWILKNAFPVIKRLGNLEDYFTDVEVQNYEFFEVSDNTREEYPLKFPNAVSLTPNEPKSKQYGFYLTVRRIKYLHSAGILQVIPELQRGGRKNAYDELKTKVNKSRVAEIANKISNGKYFYNSISFNLVDNDKADWNYDGNTITIKEGTLIVPDGNHRAFSCENVAENNPHLDDKFHVLFTVLTPSETRKKIDQEWNTEPVSKSQKEYMVNNNSNKILDMILRDEELDEIIKNNIITSSDQKSSNQGAYVYSDISKAIEIYYNGNKISTREEQRELADWLTKVFNRIVYIFKDDINNFTAARRKKWNVSSYAMYGFIYLSKEVQRKDDWKKILDECLRRIDFTDTDVVRSNKSDKVKINTIEKIFSEVINNVNV